MPAIDRFHDYKVAGIDMAQLNRWCKELAIKRPVLELRGRLIVVFKPELYNSLQW